tara:strand:+ start:382 stop:549 length:168 start_codon:yes stop_codon:yes gene_type:complete
MKITAARPISAINTISVTRRIKILDVFHRFVKETVMVMDRRHIRVAHEIILNTNQ